jgi:glycosyltransferase involved in cell wall biosynthesis
MKTPNDVSVSVVIPTFKGNDFIATTLKSVCSELIAGDEIIVVDDASFDETPISARRFLDAKSKIAWKVVVSDCNLGPPATRNIGLRMSQGDVVMSVDQDDIWTPGHRNALLQALRHHDIASGRALFEFLKDSEKLLEHKWWRDEWINQPQRLCEFGASAIKRECFERIGLLDENFRLGGDDVEWFARAQSAGLSRVEIDDIVLVRNIHHSNLSRDPRLKKELLDVIRHHLRRDTL